LIARWQNIEACSKFFDAEGTKAAQDAPDIRAAFSKSNQATLVQSPNYQPSTMNFQLILEASTYGKAVGSS
jgi:hypothetical protein